jgi:hypothetical protein
MEDWPIVWPGEGGVSAHDPETAKRAVAAATSQLAALAGGLYGVATYDEAYRLPGGGGCLPYPSKGADGAWRNVHGARACCELPLDHQPVQSILEVTVFGEIQDASTYTAQRGILRRRGSCWPTTDPCFDPPVNVRYRAGRIPPMAAGLALGELANEYVEALGGHDCKLPSSVTSVVRQGVSHTFTAPDVLAALRLTGLPLVDAWLRSVNPGRLIGRSRVYSPDLPSRVR